MSTLHRLAVPLLLLLPACTTWTSRHYDLDRDLTLAQRQLPDGSAETWVLHLRGGGDAVVERRGEVVGNKTSLGLELQELDKAAAEKRGVRPFTGLLVRGAKGQEAGLVLAGDVVLAVDGKETFYLEQLRQLEAGLRPGQPVPARVLRGQAEQTVTLAVGTVADTRSIQESFPLVAVTPSKPYAGVVLRGIPRALCERIYGQPREAAVVSRVETGSPAYLAGVRAGDVIETVDGVPCPEVHALASQIEARGRAGQGMRWHVVRGTDQQHDAELALRDYENGTDVWFPLVFRVRDDVETDRWSIGPFGLLMNRRSTWIAEPRERTPQTESVFNAVLGLIHVESRPDDTDVRLLWFIHID